MKLKCVSSAIICSFAAAAVTASVSAAETSYVTKEDNGRITWDIASYCGEQNSNIEVKGSSYDGLEGLYFENYSGTVNYFVKNKKRIELYENNAIVYTPSYSGTITITGLSKKNEGTRYIKAAAGSYDAASDSEALIKTEDTDPKDVSIDVNAGVSFYIIGNGTAITKIVYTPETGTQYWSFDAALNDVKDLMLKVNASKDGKTETGRKSMSDLITTEVYGEADAEFTVKLTDIPAGFTVNSVTVE